MDQIFELEQSQQIADVEKVIKDELPDLVKVGEYSQKIKTESRAIVFVVDDLFPKIVKSFVDRANFANGFAHTFLKNHGVQLFPVPFKNYLCATPDRVREIANANGRKNVPKGIFGTIVKNQHVVSSASEEQFSQRAEDTAKRLGLSVEKAKDPKRLEEYQADFSTHEAVHPLAGINRILRGKSSKATLPKWLTEGIAIYIGSKTRNLNYLEIAKNFEGEIPPITLGLMNEHGTNGLYHFGHIRLQRIDLHPAIIACGSFLQFLDNEGVLKIPSIWELIMKGEGIVDVFERFKTQTGLSIVEAESRWLETIGKKPVKRNGSDKFQMEVIDFTDDGKPNKKLIEFDYLKL